MNRFGNTEYPNGVSQSVVDRYTRRVFLAALPSAVNATTQQARKPREMPRVGEFVRYIDPVTENTLVRLTALSSSNRLPSPQNAFVAARSRFLVFSSDRTGAFCPHLVDLRSGAVRQLAETVALDPSSLSLHQTERSLFFLDGGSLRQVHIPNRGVNTVMEGVSAFSGRSEADILVVRQGRLQRIAGETLATGALGPCLLSPDGALCLFCREAGTSYEFWLTPVREQGVPKRLAAGRIRYPFWSPDSQSIFFLRDLDRNGVALSEIRRAFTDGTPEETVSATGQFAAFAPNGNASVFVVASRSKSQPTVDLLLRLPKRDLTLCEHHAVAVDSVTPVFAPDSRRVYFQSDREGKPAIYSINIELLVEPTIS